MVVGGRGKGWGGVVVMRRWEGWGGVVMMERVGEGRDEEVVEGLWEEGRS